MDGFVLKINRTGQGSKIIPGLIIIGGERKGMTDKLGEATVNLLPKESLQSLSPRPPLPDPSFSSFFFVSSIQRPSWQRNSSQSCSSEVPVFEREARVQFFSNIRVVLLRVRYEKVTRMRVILALRVRTHE